MVLVWHESFCYWFSAMDLELMKYLLSFSKNWDLNRIEKAMIILCEMNGLELLLL